MAQTVSWQWLLAMSIWNPLPNPGIHYQKSCDSYCPKPLPKAFPTMPYQCDNYQPKPLVSPIRECGGIPNCFEKKPFPILRTNNFSGTILHDKCPGPDAFGLKPRP